MSNLNSKQKKLHERIIKATNSDEGFVHVDETEVAPLVAAGLVEVNIEMRDNVGNVAARAITQEKEPAVSNINTAETAAVKAAPKFAIASVALPAVSRAPREGAMYPFDQLEVGQSFFVPDDPTKLDKDGKHVKAAKSLASTVTSANERYSEVIEGEFRVNRKGATVPATRQLRTFAVRAVADGAPWGSPGVSGAAVGRTA